MARSKTTPRTLLIKNYGLFWERSRVVWGGPNKRGHLKGTLTNKSKPDPADFRDQQGVYVLYDDSFSILYVGQAGSGENRLLGRLKHHRKGPLAARWSRFSWFGLRPVVGNSGRRKLKAEAEKANPTQKRILNHIEAILIAVGEPPHNRQSGRFGKHVQQYRQYDDSENRPLTLEETTEKLLMKMQALEKTVGRIWESV